MDTQTKEFVKNCIECNVFTNKKAKELIQPHAISQNCWEKVSFDLFGTRPSSRRIVVVQDLKSRFPVAKLVIFTSADKVIPAFEET